MNLTPGDKTSAKLSIFLKLKPNMREMHTRSEKIAGIVKIKELVGVQILGLVNQIRDLEWKVIEVFYFRVSLYGLEFLLHALIAVCKLI